MYFTPHTTCECAVTTTEVARDQHAIRRLLALQSLRRAVAPLRPSCARLRDRQASTQLQE